YCRLPILRRPPLSEGVGEGNRRSPARRWTIRVISTLTVELGERSYPILVGADLLRDGDRFAPFIVGRQVCIVTNETIAPLFLSTLQNTLARYAVDACVLPDGEQHKTLATYGKVMDHLIAHRHARSTTLIALGGGVIGDITGFAAATYQR